MGGESRLGTPGFQCDCIVNGLGGTPFPGTGVPDTLPVTKTFTLVIHNELIKEYQDLTKIQTGRAFIYLPHHPTGVAAPVGSQ